MIRRAITPDITLTIMESPPFAVSLDTVGCWTPVEDGLFAKLDTAAREMRAEAEAQYETRQQDRDAA